MVETRTRPDARTLIGFLGIVVFAGLNFVAVRFSNRELPPFWGATLRFAAATMILFILVRALRRPLPRGAALRGALVYGVFAFAASYALGYWGLVYVPAGTGSVIFALLPLATLFLAAAVRLERLTGRAVAGAVIALVGTAIIFQDQLSAALPALPAVAIVASMLFSAASGIVVKRMPRSDPFATNAVGMGIGTVILAGLSVLAGETVRLPAATATWIAVVWLIGSTIGLFGLYVWVLSQWTASGTSYSIVLAPLVTVAAASTLAGEPVTLLFALGTVVVLAGVYVGALLQRRGAVPSGESNRPR